MKLKSIFNSDKPVIGMVHLQALPGAPAFCGDLQNVLDAAQRDIEALQNGGANGLMFENFNDVPFYPDTVPAETIAAFTSVLAQLKKYLTLPFGVNVLRNDGMAAIAIAVATGAQFIRVNVFSGATVTDQGVLQAQAHEIVRKRAQIAPQVKIFADVQVKHGKALIRRPIGEEALELLERSRADALICSGSMTGQAVDMQDLHEIRAVVRDAAVILGSGATAENWREYGRFADAVIVGTALKKNGDVGAAVEENRVKEFMRQIQELK